MAKKISKHSRAARRGEIDVAGEARTLENLPREENNDLKKHIIRTTIKNENLLAKKMELDRIKKKGNKKLSHTLKHKTQRNSKLEGVLASKIQQSIEKAKYVQTARKSGWDQINKNIVIRNEMVDAQGESNKISEKDAEQKEEDEYVKSFFEDVQKSTEAEKDVEEPVKPTKPSGNIFDMLEETEG